MANVRRIFPGGNTSEGFYSLHDNIIGTNRNMLYILKGMPGGGKSSMMKEIGKRAYEKGYSVELHHCPSDPNSIDAVVIEELKICIIDGTPPHAIDPTYPGLTETIIDLTQFINTDKIVDSKEEIIKAKGNNKKAYRRAFNYFKAAKNIYSEIEEVNKEFVDFKAINNLSKELILEIFSKEPIEVNKDFKVRRLFSSAYTPNGYVDNIKTILNYVDTRYYLQGDTGTGKSVFLERVIDAAKLRDYHIEIYYNPLIPTKIESVIIFELDTIISSNLRTKEFPNTLIDFNQFFNKPEEKSGEENYDIKMFNELVLGGVEGLRGAKDNHQALEDSYKKAVNYKGVDEVKERLWAEIESYMK
ncbi:MAG: ATP-binding protein [Tissierellaceae bacterium]|nr:ATP-binding protein [Tissierellaceae bacterium]